MKIGTTFGYINRSGTVIIQPQFDEARFFYKALAPVRKGSTWGYIDHTGKLLISPKSEVARSFQDDVARVQINGLWGYIDTAPVKTGGLRGYIDKAGAFAIKLRFEIAHSFSNRWADVKIAGNGVTSTAKVRLRFRPGLTKPVRCGPGLLLRGRVPSGATSLATFRSKSNRSSTPPGPFNRAWPT